MYLTQLQEGILISDRDRPHATQVKSLESQHWLDEVRGWKPQQHMHAFVDLDAHANTRPLLIELARLLRRALQFDGRMFISKRTLAGLEPNDLCLAGLTSKKVKPNQDAHPSWLTNLDIDWTQAWTPRARPIEPDPRPLVSLIITAYKPDWFTATLRSALDQRWSHTEIIIGDDCPTDDIARIVKTQGGGDTRIRYHRNPPPGNARNNYLTSLSRAQGKYIKFLNDDDLLHTDCIWRLIHCLEAEPGCTIATSARQLIDAQGRPLMGRNGKQWLSWTDSIIEGSSLAALQLVLRASFVGEPSTVLFRRSDIANHQPHFMSFAGTVAPALGDIHAWTSLLSGGDVAYLATPLSSFRQHPKQNSLSGTNRHRFIDAWVGLRDLALTHGIGHQMNRLQIHRRPMKDRPWWTRAYRSAWETAQTQTTAENRLEAWNAVCQLDSHCLESRLQFAKTHIHSNQIMQAMTLLESVVSQYPGYLPAVALMAHCSTQVGHAAAGQSLFRATMDGLGPWMQTRSNMGPSGITLNEPHDVWMPVPEPACTAQFTLSHARAHSNPLGIQIETSNLDTRRILLKPGSSLNVPIPSPEGQTQLTIRITKLSPEAPTTLPDIRCGSFQLNLD